MSRKVAKPDVIGIKKASATVMAYLYMLEASKLDHMPTPTESAEIMDKVVAGMDAELNAKAAIYINGLKDTEFVGTGVTLNLFFVNKLAQTSAEQMAEEIKNEKHG